MPQSPKVVQIDHSLDVAGRMRQARSIDWDSLGLQPSHPRLRNAEL